MRPLSTLRKMTKNELINEVCNDWLEKEADAEDAGCGKGIPYIGWFWRATDIAGKRITIGDCGQFVGVMENNKWGYPERLMSEDEVDQFVHFIDRAFETSTKAAETAVLVDLWAWFQTLDFQKEHE